MKIFDEHGKPMGEIEKPGLIQQSGNWWESVSYRKVKQGEHYYNDQVNCVYEANRDMLSESWIMRPVPTPTPTQLKSIGMKLDGDRPKECHMNDVIWDKNIFQNYHHVFASSQDVGTYRWHLVKAAPAKATGEKETESNQCKEIECLGLAVDDFAKEMKIRLIHKALEGFTGWDGTYPENKLCEEIEIDATVIATGRAKNKTKLSIDIANRAMMLWYRATKPPVAQAGKDEHARFISKVSPIVVCLCGSTRFYETWQEANYNETMAGKIVLAVGFYPHCVEKAHAAHVGVTPEQKIALDELHKRKIDLADEVLILNVGGYIGESTQSELEYARTHNKIIRFLEPESKMKAGKDEGHTSCEGCKHAINGQHRTWGKPECDSCYEDNLLVVDKQERKNYTPQPPKGEDAQMFSPQMAWQSIFCECKKLGMPIEADTSGLKDVLAFIRDLHRRTGRFKP